MTEKEKLEEAKNLYQTANADQRYVLESLFPELKESEDEKNVKDLIDELKCSLRAANCQNDACRGGHEKRIALLEWAIAWLEKQTPVKFNDEKDEKIRKELLESFKYQQRESRTDKEWLNGIKLSEVVSWLEKQGNKETKKVSIWKHWKDGIAGGEEGKQIYLIKSGLRYSISSCLGQECDYIELSELDKLMREEKPKWTEEDEYHWTICLECVEECATRINTDFSKTIQWLQSLKQRIVQ